MSSVVGTFRTFDIDISSVATVGLNAVAVQITRPFDRALPSANQDTDLAISFVDWSPEAPDGNMGLWRPVFLDQYSSLALSKPYLTVLPLSSVPPLPASPCDVALTANLSCALILSDGRRIIVAQQITVLSIRTLRFSFNPEDFPQLHLTAASLWWPWQMGDAALNSLTCTLQSPAAGEMYSSTALLGLRWVSSILDSNGHRLFSVNGHPILIRSTISPQFSVFACHRIVHSQ
jgi:exo-1,4-beta-D-glucosaminidase